MQVVSDPYVSKAANRFGGAVPHPFAELHPRALLGRPGSSAICSRTPARRARSSVSICPRSRPADGGCSPANMIQSPTRRDRPGKAVAFADVLPTHNPVGPLCQPLGRCLRPGRRRASGARAPAISSPLQSLAAIRACVPEAAPHPYCLSGSRGLRAFQLAPIPCRDCFAVTIPSSPARRPAHARGPGDEPNG
jgi:hypothetical protein